MKTNQKEYLCTFTERLYGMGLINEDTRENIIWYIKEDMIDEI